MNQTLLEKLPMPQLNGDVIQALRRHGQMREKGAPSVLPAGDA